MKLSDLKIYQKAKIKKLNIEDVKYKTRLEELGLFVGSEICVLNFSPLKETLLVQIFNSVFALKNEIAKQIEVEC